MGSKFVLICRKVLIGEVQVIPVIVRCLVDLNKLVRRRSCGEIGRNSCREDLADRVECIALKEPGIAVLDDLREQLTKCVIACNGG